MQRPSPRPLVITTSARSAVRIPDAGEAPRVDFQQIIEALDADVVYRAGSTPFQHWLDRKVLRGGDWRAAYGLRNVRPSVCLTLSESVGMPLALVGPRGVPHVMIAHNLTTKKRRMTARWTRYLQQVDRIVVLSRAQERFLRDEVGLAAERVVFVHDKVDHRFFVPSAAVAAQGNLVVAVGRERRDYATLVEAVRGTTLKLVIVPSSLWMPSDQIGRNTLPPNVEIRQGLAFTELRALYASAAAVAVPLMADVDYAAGVNAVLEGMAMAKPVVVSASRGLDSYLDDGAVRPVPPGNPAAMREALLEVIQSPATALALGQRARQIVEAGRNLDSYVAAIARTVTEAAAARRS
ncbi:MAG: sugar transferase, PEP-CTERM/EpsH1 system associated [Myxococcaceae bacterium]|nr:sugar transferase, PEP-CTERM/EpsH1 system associated [Myxococcaceae bacterium]